jgi:sigma-B regulation protein RsbU (phosphoserine phosphatase)
VRQRLHTLLTLLGRSGLAFLAFALLYVVLGWAAPGSLARPITMLALLISGIWMSISVLRRARGQLIWSLRNRLLVTYLLIAAVPILLVAMLAYFGGQALVSQLAVYMVTSQLERRIDTLESFTESVVRTDPATRPFLMEKSLDLFYADRFPGIEILLRERDEETRYPEGATITAPIPGWKPTRGVLVRDGKFFLWSYDKTRAGDVTVMAPLTSEFLAELVPRLGKVDVMEKHFSDREGVAQEVREMPVGAPLPPSQGRFARFDQNLSWYAILEADDWDHPGQKTGAEMLIAVRSRVGLILAEVFSHKDPLQSTLEQVMIAVLIIFAIFELASVVWGIAFARTITGAVHRLYESTQLVIAGDFSHRIQVTGNDQLAELSKSFNRMTEHLQQLLVVAKEKERLESEIEIAREVQNQLFPREVPELRTLRIQAVCQPARLVSGDYYDFERVGEDEVALAIADVAGKGISAALLMAALQSSLRVQLQTPVEVLAVAGGGAQRGSGLSTSRLVSNLNRQLYSMTSAEKYATFCLGIYDEPSSTFTYTNAGHLSPLLIRDGAAELLDVNGTVVGAFDFSQYTESTIELRSGDLLVFYTDGVTEPENEYGEMFGEERLIQILTRNAHRREEDIIALVLDSVKQWTATEELQDDMTLLLARRV